MSNSRANSFIKKVLYQLKKEHSQLVDLYLRGAVSTDVSTGKITYPETRWRILKGIVLPIDALRNLVQAPPFATAGRQFEFGAFYSTATSSIILDWNDLPKNYTLNQVDAFIIDHQRFQIKETHDHKVMRSVIFLVEQLRGQRVDEAYEIRQLITCTHGATLG